MAKFRKKPVIVEATQWFANGDHPGDDSELMLDPNGEPFLSEGKVVRRYRDPSIVSSLDTCGYCDKIFHLHGWIDTLEGGHIVCPGDWIITGIHGEMYPCKPNIFEKTYEPA